MCGYSVILDYTRKNTMILDYSIWVSIYIECNIFQYTIAT